MRERLPRAGGVVLIALPIHGGALGVARYFVEVLKHPDSLVYRADRIRR